MPNGCKKLETSEAPRAIGPYSQGVSLLEPRALIFVSGQLPVDPKSEQIIGGDIQAMTKQVIDNLEAVLLSGGSGLEHVVRTDVFLTNLKDFAAMNEEYAKRFNGPVPPARQTIQVSALPMGASIEISCVAVKA